MDRQQLLDYYSTHYLSRQEILFKLPFSISAEAFWQELVNRRKAKATILPLYNAAGKPYWYCMTDKMIAASETLCEEAIRQGEFDPYRMEMTTAMTWEMFFTSFLEGAELDLDEALDYLSRDEEPASVQEQLLWNNRQAMCAMVRGIYRPIDESVLMQLASLLTKDLDSGSEGYRQTDTHLIAAMGDEAYEVPAARDIPERMQSLYTYLAQPDIHPLLKAAVGQAYLLAVRPFPDGNERLSRMVSTLILYRSGYDYFRDISLSRKLAQESYRYYKNMKELLRPGSDGDMTCFMEYFIDVLARALADAKKEAAQQEERRANEALSQERQLAGTPLQPAQKESAPVTPEVRELIAGAETMTLLSENIANAEESPAALMNTVTVSTNPRFQDIVTQLCCSPHAGSQRMGETIRRMLKQGVEHFTVAQWAAYTQRDLEGAKNDCYYLRKRGVIENRGNLAKADYYWRMKSAATESCEPIAESHPPVLAYSDTVKYSGWDETSSSRINEMLRSNNSKEVRMAQTLLRLAEDDHCDFTGSAWAKASGITPATGDKELRDLVGMGLLYRTGSAKQYIYHIGASPNGVSGMKHSKTQSEILNRLQTLFHGNFSIKQAADGLGLKSSSFSYHLKSFLAFGDVIPVPDTYPALYCLTSSPQETEPQNTASPQNIVILQPEIKRVAAGAEQTAAWV